MRACRCAGVVALVLLAVVVPPAPAQDRGAARLVVQMAPEVNPWTHLEINDDPDRFQFAIVADRTGGHRPGVFEEAVRKLNLLQPEFVMSVGDLIEGYTQSEDLIDRQWQEFDGFVRQLEMPFFYVPGNHDISNPVMAAKWAERRGRSYYHFVYKDVLFLCLNTEDPPATRMSEDQVEYVRAALGENAGVRWTLVFMHKPMWTYPQKTGWERIEALLQGRPHTVIAGHNHTYMKFDRNQQNYIILATTGGGSALRGPLFGQFDHVVWVTMTDRGPRIANLMLEGIWDENIRTEESFRLARSLLEGRALVASPILADQALFEDVTSQIRLTNDADLPLRVRASFQPHPLLRPSLEGLDLTVPPNEVQFVDLTLHLIRPARTSEIPPLTLDWTATYAPPDQPSIEVHGALRFVVETLIEVPRRAEPVAVDGSLREWAQLPHLGLEPAEVKGDAGAWQGPGDASFRFAVERDEDYLYIAVEAVDERLVRIADRLPWEQDGVEIRLDGRPDPGRSAGRGQGEMEDHLLLALSPGATLAEMVVFNRDRWPAGIQAASLSGPAGHATEVAIPLNYLNQKQQGPWDAFRLNVTLNDVDEEGGPRTQLWWRPDWRGELNYPGSGTFRRR